MTAAEYKRDNSIKWFLAIIALFGLAMLIIPFFLIPPAFLYLELTDSVFINSGFEGMKSEITNSESGVPHSFMIQKWDGKFVVKVGKIDSGKTNWSMNVKGYYPTNLEVDIPPMEKGIYQVSLRPNFGRLNIIPVNVVKPEEPIDSEIKLKIAGEEISKKPGNRIISRLSPGSYQIHAEVSGFYPAEGKGVVREAVTADTPIFLFPILKANEVARIVLLWDVEPRDLDSHLFFPDESPVGNRHIYYPARYMNAFSGIMHAASLDVDDTTSYGPETVTIYKAVNGRYEYAIYHYAGEGTIGTTSKAEVTVITHSTTQKFSAPLTCTMKWWHVMDLEIKGSDVRIIPVNACVADMGWKTGKK
ncbi:MAG TPA: hypothetical protein VK186_28350 [Candidatus Deferrimicrobium sp.]|nr:hypothetical protein [Candidatus Deferrimicrobium sp.]